MGAQPGGGMGGWMVGWEDGRMVGGRGGGGMDGYMDGYMDGREDGSRGECMDGWVEGPAPGWLLQHGVDLCCWPIHPLPPPCTPGTPLRDAGNYLTPAVAAGMLAGGAQKEVTLVNALLLAQEAGLKVRGHLGLLKSAWCSQTLFFRAKQHGSRVAPWGC